ncbi:MAG TPA: hypothetical protein VHX38_10010 [Pseudonocardiaceae bacterium]|jgi:hypothetical protein|nr:hypothetical protein [Pseudonocardiaceae bacterium]
MSDPDSRQPLAVWVHLASSIVRTALEEQGVVPVEEAVSWLAALEATALEALDD